MTIYCYQVTMIKNVYKQRVLICGNDKLKINDNNYIDTDKLYDYIDEISELINEMKLLPDKTIVKIKSEYESNIANRIYTNKELNNEEITLYMNVYNIQ